MSAFARSPVGRTRDPDMCFLGMSRRITPSKPSSRQLAPSSPETFSWDLKGELGAGKLRNLSRGKYAWMVRDRKKRECFLSVSSMWLVARYRGGHLTPGSHFLGNPLFISGWSNFQEWSLG